MGCTFYWKNAVLGLVWAAMAAALIWFVVWMFGNYPSMAGLMYPLIILAPICGGASLYMLAWSWWSCSGRDPLTQWNAHDDDNVGTVQVATEQVHTYQGVSYVINSTAEDQKQ